MFTLVGDHLNDVLLCAGERGFRITDMRHEAAVVHAADAYARLTRKPALALVTGGPGHTNALTGIATAYSACSPVLSVSGAKPSNQMERGAFQDVDQLGMVKPVVKWAAQPSSAEQIPWYVGRALKEATAGRMGPVHLTIPVDLFAAGVEKPSLYPSSPEPEPATPSVDAAIELLSGAERPLAIAGAGVWWADAGRELAAFAEHCQIPVFTISMARGVISDEHPMCFGYADPALSRAAAKALQEADVVLVLGKRIDFRLGLGSPRVIPSAAKVIQVDIHPIELGLNRKLDVAICADVRTTLRALTAASQPRDRSEWLERLRAFRIEWVRELTATAQDRSTPIHPAAFFAQVSEGLPTETLISWDGGDFVHWGRAMLPARHPGGWMRLGPLGTIGAALPNAIALGLANPDKPIVMITGDGSLGFYLAELDTAVRHNLPFVVIVGNDAGWGLERELQKPARSVGCELRATRYDIVMQGLGGEGENITSVEEVRPALERAFASRRPYLLNVNVRGVRSPFTRWKLGD
jgi:acetolactate synthase-1/2/3 large subunit